MRLMGEARSNGKFMTRRRCWWGFSESSNKAWCCCPNWESGARQNLPSISTAVYLYLEVSLLPSNHPHFACTAVIIDMLNVFRVQKTPLAMQSCPDMPCHATG